MNKLLIVLFFSLLLCIVSNGQHQIWGSSSQGGNYGNGFIFKSDATGDNLEIVHHFKSSVDGENISGLTLASNNKLYGMAGSGGYEGANVFASGTLFEYDLNTDQFRVITRFGPANTALPGIYLPRAEGVPALAEVRPGVLYGLMRQGSYVFAYDIATEVFSQPFVLPTYQGGSTNGVLHNKLNQAFFKTSAGEWYVSTKTNSSCPIPNPNMGSIMRLGANGTSITTRYLANCLGDKGIQYAGFFAEVDGKLYSTGGYGGLNNKGVIFEYNPATNVYTKKHDFDGSTYSYEATSLIYAGNGKLYGTAFGGGIPEPTAGLPAGGGVLFEFDLNTNTFTKKHNFTITGQSIYDVGVFPSGLIQAFSGKLYGATQYGIFEYDTASTEVRVAGRFNGQGFSASLLEICRKPAYQMPAINTFTLCEGAAFTLDLSSSNTTSATWDHNGITDLTRTGTVLEFEAFSEADAGTWVCTMINECGTTVSSNFTLTYGTPSQPPIQVDGPLEFCADGSVTLTGPEGFEEYQWSNGETTQQIVVTESGSYTLKVNDACESPWSEPIEVTVYELPGAPDVTINSEGTLLTASGGTGIYAWTYNDALLNTDASEIVATETGSYKVYSLSTEGCRSADFASMDVIITGIEGNPHRGIKVYPNPGKGVFYVEVNKDWQGLAEASVIDARGIIVYRQPIILNDEPFQFSLEHLPAGLYELIILKAGKLMTNKIVCR